MARPPLIETLIRDLENKGHAFSYSKVDTNNYLLPQRRNRVFGCSSHKGAKTPEQVDSEKQQWKHVFGKLGMGPASQQFTLEDILLPDLEKRPLQAAQDVRNWQLIKSKVKRAKQNGPLCMHMGSSEARLEYMVGASTCVRPSHEIFCGLAGRPFVGTELLRLQGSFGSDYPHPEEIERLPEGLAKDMAGNAFPTTVLQANFISSLVCHNAWQDVAARVDCASPAKPKCNRKRRHTRQPPEGDSGEPDETKKKKNSKQRPSDDGMLVEDITFFVCVSPIFSPGDTED